MAASGQISFTKAQQNQLQHLSDILHLFHHRNKNQHRRSIWYRHFSTFRKQLTLLLASISELNTVPTTHLERSQKKKRDPVLQGELRERLKFWQDVLVPQWHFAFSQLVADGRFAVLGLLLVAVLSEVCGVVGVIEHFEEVGELEVRRVIERFGREEGMDGMEGGHGGRGEGEDVGVAVSRAPGEGREGMSGKSQRRIGEVSDGYVVGGRGEGRPMRSEIRASAAAQPQLDAAVECERDPLEARPSSPLTNAEVAPWKSTERPETTPSTKRPLPASKTKAAAKTKKRKKGDTIDELFSGLR